MLLYTAIDLVNAINHDITYATRPPAWQLADVRPRPSLSHRIASWVTWRRHGSAERAAQAA